MKILFKQDFFNITAGTTIEVKRNQVNYWVGCNGCGKSVTAAAIMTKLDNNKSRWMAALPAEQAAKLMLENFEGFSGVSFYSSKTRQAQFIDADLLLSIQGATERLKASEGTDAMVELSELVTFKDDIDHLFILDELDRSLDFRTKFIFFEIFLKRVKGTVIVITHDAYFLLKLPEVFNFEKKILESSKSYINNSVPNLCNYDLPCDIIY